MTAGQCSRTPRSAPPRSLPHKHADDRAVDSAEKVLKLTPSGELKERVTGVTTALGLAFDHQGRLYVLESMTAPGFPGPAQAGTGTILRIDHSGTVETIATGFTTPTAMTFGPDGALYVSNFGFGAPVPGLGQIVRVVLPD